MKVSVLGAGATGCAAAAVFSKSGADVTLFGRAPQRLRPIADRGGIEITGDWGEELVRIPRITTEIEDAARADLICVCVVANAQAELARMLAPFVRSDQLVLLLSGSAGSLEVSRVWRELGLLRPPLLGETNAPLQPARMIGPAQVRMRIYSERTIRLATFPARGTPMFAERLCPLIRFEQVRNVLDTGLNNPNFVLHPVSMILNYAAIERADGMLSLMNEGMTQAVLRAIDAHDRERTALQRAVGLEPLALDDLLCELGGGPAYFRSPGEPMGLRDRIHFRYVDEDVPYGTVFMSSIGRLVGVPTPISDAITVIASSARGIDYWAVGRTLERLGLEGFGPAELDHYLEAGERS